MYTKLTVEKCRHCRIRLPLESHGDICALCMRKSVTGWPARIKGEREKRGWGKREMGRRLLHAVGIPLTPVRVRSIARQMQEWEKGTHFPREWARPYAMVFESTVDDLFPSVATEQDSTGPERSEDVTKDAAKPDAETLLHSLVKAITDSAAVKDVLAGLVKSRADGAVVNIGPPEVADSPAIAGDGPSQESANVTAGILGRSPTPGVGEDDMRRRAALQMIAALGTGTAIPPGAIETVLSGIDDAVGNPLDLSEWERIVCEYGERILVDPAGSLTQELTGDVITVGGLLGSPSGSAVRGELLRIAAGLSGLLAIDLNDVGDKRAARLSWATARRAADASGDRDLQVWVRAKEAQKACWAERPRDVVAHLTAEAIDIANEVPSSGLARAYAAVAYVAAERGDSAGVNSAMSSLRRTFESLPTAMTTSYSQTPGTLHEGLVFWSEAYARTILGDNQANQAIDQALALSPGSIVNEELELFRALAMVREREINTGLEHAINTIENRPLGAFRHRMVRQIVSAAPVEARALTAAQELQALTSK